MKKLALLVILLLTMGLSACSTDESALRDSSSILLGAKEVKELILGNTVISTDGDTYYFDRSGVVIGKGSYGEKNRGNWNITPEGQLCLTNWNSSYAPSACFKLFFDNDSQQRKLVDGKGNTKYTILNILTGNPNNF